MITLNDIGLAFRMFDPSNKRCVSEDDAGLLLQALVGDLTAEELHATVKAMDVECNGTIQRDDFERLVLRKSSEHSITEDVWRSFLCLTRSGAKLDAGTIREFCATHRCVTEKQLDALLRQLITADPAAAGTISYELWKRVITSLS